MSAPSEDKQVTRELSKRRVFAFVAIFLAVSLPEVAYLEGDQLLHALDDYGVVAVSILVVIFLAMSWKKQSLTELKKQHNIILILFVIALLFKLFAISQELNDPTDFGDEPPLLILLIITLVNRFI
jgi:fucose permease